MAVMEKPTGPQNFQAYKRHIVSEHLKDRYPYLEDINSHLKPDEVSMGYGQRLYPRLVEQLKTAGLAPEKLGEALCTICDLCANQENKCEAVASGVVEAVTDLLMHDSVEVRREAARAIGIVALIFAGRVRMPLGSSNMPSSGGASALVPGETLKRLAKLLLACDDEVVKRNTAEALLATTIFRDGCQQVVDMGTVKATAQYLCATLPDLPPTRALSLCLLHLLRTLAAVTMYAVGGMRDVLGCGLIAKVVAFLERVPLSGLPSVNAGESVETVQQALRMLWHSGNDPQGRKEMLKADAVRVITKYLLHQDAKVREAAVCALNVISLETHGKQEVLLHSVQSLAALLHSEEETRYLHETCVQLCRSASELPAFRFAFARHILASVWLLEKVYGTTTLAAVCDLMAPSEPEVDTRVSAAQVVAHFLRPREDGKYARGDEIRVPPVCPLRHIEQPCMFAIEECTSLFHHLVALMDLELGRDTALECLDALTSVAKPRQMLQKLLDDQRVTVSRESLEELKKMLAAKDPASATPSPADAA